MGADTFLQNVTKYSIFLENQRSMHGKDDGILLLQSQFMFRGSNSNITSS